MRPFLLSIAGLVALNAALIFVMAGVDAWHHRRITREIRGLENVWRLDRPRPARRHSLAARTSALFVATVLVCAGAAVASPGFRHVMTSRIGELVGVGEGSDAPTLAEGTVGPPPPSPGGVIDAGPADGEPLGRSDDDAEGPSEREPVLRTSAPSPTDAPSSTTAPGLIGPVAVTASATSTTQITVGWLAVPTATAYHVERSPDGVTSWVQVGAVAADATSTVDTGLEPSTTYHYRVSATTLAGSTPPTYASATTPPEPASPSGVTAVAASSSEVALEWSDVAHEIGYRVQRSADGQSDWLTIGSTGQDLTSYRDLGLAPATTYHYRIVAVGPMDEETAPSSTTSVTTPAA